MPETQNIEADVLLLEEQRRRNAAERHEATSTSRRGEQQAEEAGDRPVSQQADAAGCTDNKFYGLPEAECCALSARTLSGKRTQELCGIANQPGMTSEVANPRRAGFFRMRIKEIVSVRKRYVFWRIHVLLLCEIWKINHRRVYRLGRKD